jgi:hypothetical protein
MRHFPHDTPQDPEDHQENTHTLNQIPSIGAEPGNASGVISLTFTA